MAETALLYLTRSEAGCGGHSQLREPSKKYQSTNLQLARILPRVSRPALFACTAFLQPIKAPTVFGRLTLEPCVKSLWLRANLVRVFPAGNGLGLLPIFFCSYVCHVCP